MSASRDAFGRLIGQVESLDMPGRVDVLRRLSGTLQASQSREQRWLGYALGAWLANGGDLAERLGVRPPQGSHCTAQSIVLQARRDQVLLRLSVAMGSDAQAVRVLCGRMPCPPMHAELLREARELRCPVSRAAFERARRRASRHT